MSVEQAGPMDLKTSSTRELLGLYGSILEELLSRGVIRTRNSPVGDYAERLVAKALNGALEPNSTASWDLVTPAGKRVQVKCRVVGPATSRSAKFSPFRSYNFDSSVFVVLEQGTYEVVSAISVPSASVEAKARFSPHVAGASITLGTNLLSLVGARDLTDLVRAAAEA